MVEDQVCWKWMKAQDQNNLSKLYTTFSQQTQMRLYDVFDYNIVR